jgi:hypothetical protein
MGAIQSAEADMTVSNPAAAALVILVLVFLCYARVLFRG